MFALIYGIISIWVFFKLMGFMFRPQIMYGRENFG